MDIDKTLKEMSLENKVKLCIDGALWRTAAIPENDVPILYMSDGTNGLRFWKNQKEQDPMSRDFSSEFGSMTMDDEDGINRTYEATCFPGSAPYAPSFSFSSEGVVESGNIITGKSAGWAFDLGLRLVARLKGEEAAAKVRSAIFYKL